MSLHRGNIIRFTNSFWGGSMDEPQDIIGKLGVIEDGNDSGYHVLELENGAASAWWNKNYLEFVSDGGEDIIHECQRKSEELKRQYSDLHWIKNNWEFIQNEIKGATVLTLLHEIGYKSMFESNGEFFVLQDDWIAFYPLFNQIFTGTLEDCLNQVKNILKPQYVEKYITNVTNFYNRIRI